MIGISRKLRKSGMLKLLGMIAKFLILNLFIVALIIFLVGSIYVLDMFIEEMTGFDIIDWLRGKK